MGVMGGRTQGIGTWGHRSMGASKHGAWGHWDMEARGQRGTGTELFGDKMTQRHGDMGGTKGMGQGAQRHQDTEGQDTWTWVYGDTGTWGHRGRWAWEHRDVRAWGHGGTGDRETFLHRGEEKWGMTMDTGTRGPESGAERQQAAARAEDRESQKEGQEKQ